MTALLQLSGRGSLHRQIYEALRAGILAGRLRPDNRLPATRELASELGVSRNVVLLADEMLVDEGYARNPLLPEVGLVIKHMLERRPPVRSLQTYATVRAAVKPLL